MAEQSLSDLREELHQIDGISYINSIKQKFSPAPLDNSLIIEAWKLDREMSQIAEVREEAPIGNNDSDTELELLVPSINASTHSPDSKLFIDNFVEEEQDEEAAYIPSLVSRGSAAVPSPPTSQSKSSNSAPNTMIKSSLLGIPTANMKASPGSVKTDADTFLDYLLSSKEAFINDGDFDNPADNVAGTQNVIDVDELDSGEDDDRDCVDEGDGEEPLPRSIVMRLTPPDPVTHASNGNDDIMPFEE